jgi:hypothetical protein
MRDRGIGILYGRWLIEGAPRVLLFDTKTAYSYLNEWKGDLWNVAAIPSPPNDDETNEAIVFGYLVAWFLGEVCGYSLLLEWKRNYPTNSMCSLTTVRLPREEEGRYCPLPRVAGWCRSSTVQEAPYRRHHHLHDPRDFVGKISMRWFSRLLQQPAILRC